MFTRILRIASTVLSSAAMLTLSGGCSSSETTPGRMTESHENSANHASRREATNYDRRDQPMNDAGHGTAQASFASSWGDTRSTPPANDPRITGIAPQSTQTSAVKPPLTPAETPARKIGSDEFWVAGHWLADASGFKWQAGRIERDRNGELFVSGGWHETASGWEFTPEYWR